MKDILPVQNQGLFYLSLRQDFEFAEEILADRQGNKCLFLLQHVAVRVREKISLHFRRMELGQICSIRGCKTTGIASYFEDFGVEDRTNMA